MNDSSDIRVLTFGFDKRGALEFSEFVRAHEQFRGKVFGCQLITKSDWQGVGVIIDVGAIKELKR